MLLDDNSSRGFFLSQQLGKMFDSDHTNGTSILHDLDPRIKVLLVTGFSIEMAVCSRWPALVGGAVVSLLLVLLSRLPLKHLFTRLIFINGMILFLWFFIPFSFGGKPILTIGPLNATKEGILYAFLLSLRSNIILISWICLVSTTPVLSLGYAMQRLWIPEKAVQLFFFTYRYLHVIYLEYHRLANAIKIRGFQPKTSIHTYRTYAYLIGMLLVKSYDRSERVRKAMLCRGFKGRFYHLSEFSLKSIDFIMLAVMLLVLGALALVQWTNIVC